MKKVRSKQKFTLKSIIITAACAGMGVAYLVSINGQSTAGSALTRLEHEREELKREIQSLEKGLAELASIGLVENAARSMDLVAIEEVDYATQDTGVAVGETGAKP